MRTILFDIDGTLLLTNQAGSSALQLALSQEFDLPNPCIDISYGGRTDRSLLAQLLRINNLPETDEYWDRLRRRYAAVFPDVLRQRGGSLLPGAVEILERLRGESSVRICVMTGNLTETGEQKLRHFGLLKYSQWVSGGELDADRDDLARRTAVGIRDRFGHQAPDDLVVVGDTVADVHCGHAIDAQVLAVCTGSHDRERLESEKPLAVLDDLSNTDQIFDLIMNPGKIIG